MDYTVRYSSILYCTILYDTITYHTILYYTTLHYTAPHYAQPRYSRRGRRGDVHGGEPEGRRGRSRLHSAGLCNITDYNISGPYRCTHTGVYGFGGAWRFLKGFESFRAVFGHPRYHH
eukprot:14351571-Heterocapsa_arctica.AAC.1